jgi:uncharacterized protein (DUF1697 family)
MPVYIALLRGINIGPHKRMKMDALRAGCEGLKLSEVKTYVQSGNVVFRSTQQSPGALAKKIEAMIVDAFGFSARVVVRTGDDLAAVVRNNPFRPAAKFEDNKLCVAFLSDEPAKALVEKLQASPPGSEPFQVRGNNLYIYFANGFARTKMHTNFLEKALCVEATVRNWRTVTNLHTMAQECGR